VHSIDPDLALRVRERCEAVLDGNWREGEHHARSYAFTAPSPGRYPWQWYWDSGLIAIARRRFDPARARRELECLLSANEDGFIGHVIFWGQPLNLERAIRYNVARRHDFMTRTIQPPLAAWAWRIVTGENPAGVPAIAAHHAWLREHRDLDGDGLLWLIQPDESGLDASPKYDHIWGRRAQGLRGFPLLIQRNRRRGFDARRIAADGGPVVCEVVTNVLWGLSRLAAGEPSVTPALVDRLWHEDVGRFADEARGKVVRELAPAERPLCWDTLAPLALPDLPEAIGRRLVEETLLDPAKFWDCVPLPSVSLSDPSFTTRDQFRGLRRYWRGPSWVNSAWLVWLGLRRLGYDEEAHVLAERLAKTIAVSGVREYYDPRTGAGMGAEQFGWSTLVWELVEPDPLAARSYL
jgi:hypothetical protein